MPTVLMGSELGGGTTALAPLLPIAHGLKKHGYRVVFAIRDAAAPAQFLARQGFRTLQAPVWGSGEEPPEGVSFPALLRAIGADDTEQVATVAGRWRRLIDHLAPSCIVAYLSPGLCLAARGQVPGLIVGDGFAVPPWHGPSFPILPGEEPGEETDLLSAFNAALGGLGAPPLRRLPELFDLDGAYPCVLPALDPYGETRGGAAAGPFDHLPEPVPGPGEPRVFVDLIAHFYDADAILSAVDKAGATANAWVRGVSKGFLTDFSWPGVTLMKQWPDAFEAIRNAAVVVHNGYLLTTTLCLAMGRPQLIVPDGRAAFRTAMRVRETGLARIVGKEPSPEGVAAQLRELLTLAPAAESYARSLGADAGGAAAKIVARCIELTGVERKEP